MLFFIRYPSFTPVSDIHLNTSHVILYHTHFKRVCLFLCLFKYISCYSLSLSAPNIRSILRYLNTSHVILYPQEDENLREVLQHLNTSHVILYHKYIIYIGGFGKNLNTSHVILYQSLRYSMSRLKFYLNTSHVILYRTKFARLDWSIVSFKYISCYSLSHSPGKYFRPPYLFKYISCYSLSDIQMDVLLEAVHLNTSHVILYPSAGSGLLPASAI